MTREIPIVLTGTPDSRRELGRLILSLIRRRWWIAGMTCVSIIVAGVLAYTTPPVYLAKTTLVPAEGTGSAGLAGVLGGLGGLAELANLDGPRDQNVLEAIALLKSRSFTEDFIRDESLLPVLFPDLWSKSLNRWKAGAKPPDLWQGYQRFDRDIRFVDQDDKTGMVDVRIEWRNPAQAADWANELVGRLNAQMQERALTEARTTLAYLQNELATTKVAAVQVAIQDLIEANLKREAVASVRPDYVFRVVDPAAPPDLRDKLRPHRSIYLITGAFFGFLLSTLSVLAVDGLRNLRRFLSSAAAE